MRRLAIFFSALFSIFSTVSSVPFAHAQNENTCFQRLASDMVAVHDEWRAQLFGSRRARDGSIIALTGGDVSEERTGIFETRGRLTSELIEPIMESYRVYRCRTLEVCQIATQSFGIDGGTFDLKMLGCKERTVQRYGECYFAGQSDTSDGSANMQNSATRILQRCQQVARETLDSEQAVLKLAVAYDSGYRSLLQLAGMIDWMLQGFPSQIIRAVSDMVTMLGKLHQIPCFIGQCDDPNTAGLTP